MARRKAHGETSHEHHHHHHGNVDYNVGIFAPQQRGLGRILVSVNDVEKVRSTTIIISIFELNSFDKQNIDTFIA